MTLQDKMKAINKERRLRALVLIILQRAKEAGIPEDFLRIPKDEFKKIISPSYAKSNKTTIDEIANLIYDNTEEFIKKYQFVLISGGTKYERKKAGFAILFKIISCNREGKYELWESFFHALEDFLGSASDSRNAYVNKMSSHHSLFISDFDYKEVNKSKCVAGPFIDEIFEVREDSKLPTIISFANNKDQVRDGFAGEYIHKLYNHDSIKVRNAFKIVVQEEQKMSDEELSLYG